MNFKNFLKLSEATYGVFSDNWRYPVPTDFKQLLHDFYGIVGLKNMLGGEGEFKTASRFSLPLIDHVFKALENLTHAMKEWLLWAIPYCCCSELRHIVNRSVTKTDVEWYVKDKDHLNKYAGALEIIDQAYIVYKSNKISIEDEEDEENNSKVTDYEKYLQKESKIPKGQFISLIYKKLINFFGSAEKLMEFAQEMFSLNIWEDYYGGAAWYEVTRHYFKLLNTNNIKDEIFWIDRIIDLEHNTGTLFNKINHIREKDPGFSMLNHNWISKALTVKTNSIIPYGFYENMSVAAKQLVSAFLYSSKNVTHEDYKKAKWIKDFIEMNILDRTIDKENLKREILRAYSPGFFKNNFPDFDRIYEIMKTYIDNKNYTT